MESEMKACWAGYFERLYHADELDVRDITFPIACPPINCELPLFVETQAVVNQWNGGKALGICGIKTGGNPALVLLHAVLCSGAQASSQLTGKGPLRPSLEREGDHQYCNNDRGVTTLSVPGKVFARVILHWVRHHLLQNQLGFTPKKSTIDCILVLRVLTGHR